MCVVVARSRQEGAAQQVEERPRSLEASCVTANASAQPEATGGATEDAETQVPVRTVLWDVVHTVGHKAFSNTNIVCQTPGWT